MPLHRAACLFCFLAAMLTLTSCGDSKIATVKGTVTFNGKPIESGSISFFPVDGAKAGTAGGIIKDGKYSCSDVPIGLMRVYVTGLPKLAGMKRPYPDAPEKPYYVESMPGKYSSPAETELELDVKLGVNEKDWNLKGE
jgi:hypothetical protein